MRELLLQAVERYKALPPRAKAAVYVVLALNELRGVITVIIGLVVFKLCGGI